jgi:inorganic pyrophosphatase
MADIQIEIQGQDAVAATEELFSTSGLSGDWKVAVEDKTKAEPVITTLATIVGVVGGSIAIAEQIRKWYKEYKQGKSGKKIEKVLIQGRNGRRLLLENATLEQIKEILDEE